LLGGPRVIPRSVERGSACQAGEPGPLSLDQNEEGYDPKMPPLPVRCQRCGSLSIAGLLIPPNAIRSAELNIELRVTSDPLQCPVCKSALAGKSEEVTKIIHSALRNAKLDNIDTAALLRLATDHYSTGSSYTEVDTAVQEKVPKAAGIMRFIPPADITGTLALLIAILSLADDLVVNWVMSPGSKENSSGEPTAERQPLWIRISSKSINLEHGRGIVQGSWNGEPHQALWESMFYPGPDPRFQKSPSYLSLESGTFDLHFSTDSFDFRHYKLDLLHELTRKFFILYIDDAPVFHHADGLPHGYRPPQLDAASLDVDRLKKMSAITFQFHQISDESLKIEFVSYSRWLNNYRRFQQRTP
jgi:hypothetical protein